jgi:hypothetical protein
MPAISKRASDKNKLKQCKCVIVDQDQVKPFSQIQISTKTVIVVTNCFIKLADLFQYVPITDFETQVKKRGRKKRNNNEKTISKLPFGSVIRAQHELKKRGVDLKSKSSNISALSDDGSSKSNSSTPSPSSSAPLSPSEEGDEQIMEIGDENVELNVASTETEGDKDETSSQAESVITDQLEPLTTQAITPAPAPKKAFFLHCVTLKIAIDDPEEKENTFKDVKCYSNGKLQITGIKNDQQYINTIKAVFQLFTNIEEFTGQSVVVCNEPSFKAICKTVMQNMNFYMGFNILRHKLDEFINNQTDYRSIFEGSMNNVLSIKIPIKEQDGTLVLTEFNKQSYTITSSLVKYSDYKHLFAKKTNKKDEEHTFLVFASGHIIFTSAGADMEQIYYSIVNTLIQNREIFEEKNETPQGEQVYWNF